MDRDRERKEERWREREMNKGEKIENMNIETGEKET